MYSRWHSTSLTFNLVHYGRGDLAEPKDGFVEAIQPFSFSKAPNEPVLRITTYTDRKTILLFWVLLIPNGEMRKRKPGELSWCPAVSQKCEGHSCGILCDLKHCGSRGLVVLCLAQCPESGSRGVRTFGVTQLQLKTYLHQLWSPPTGSSTR